LPPYLAKNGAAKVGPFYEDLDHDLKSNHYLDAEKAVDDIFRVIQP
jgi:hypothetical protein